MSRRVVGYENGHKVWANEGEHGAADMTATLAAVEKMTNRPRVAAVSRDRVTAPPLPKGTA